MNINKKTTKFNSSVLFMSVILTFFLIVSIVFSSMNIKKCNSAVEDNSRIKVVAVSYAQYDFIRAVCAEFADVEMLSKPGSDIHGFEPSLADIKKISGADLFVYNGGESDEWVENILASVDNERIKKLRLCDYVELICDNHGDHGHHGHEHESDEHEHFDEHIQSSPKNAVLMIQAITDAVSGLDAGHSEQYRFNSSEYIKKVKKLDDELKEISEKADNKMLVVADRFPFIYMAHHYGFEYESLFAGCSQENDAGASVMIDMIETVSEKNIKTVFYTEHTNGKLADAICAETGVSKSLLHSCEGISKFDFENGVTYVELMEKNIMNLREALL